MQEKLLKTVMAAMEIKKESTEDNVLPALMVEYASIEDARDINNYVTPCSDATAPITVAALRYVADIIERELLDVEQAEIAKKTQEALHRSTTVMKEEKKVKKVPWNRQTPQHIAKNSITVYHRKKKKETGK